MNEIGSKIISFYYKIGNKQPVAAPLNITLEKQRVDNIYEGSHLDLQNYPNCFTVVYDSLSATLKAYFPTCFRHFSLSVVSFPTFMWITLGHFSSFRGRFR